MILHKRDIDVDRSMEMFQGVSNSLPSNDFSALSLEDDNGQTKLEKNSSALCATFTQLLSMRRFPVRIPNVF